MRVSARVRSMSFVSHLGKWAAKPMRNGNDHYSSRALTTQKKIESTLGGCTQKRHLLMLLTGELGKSRW